MYKIGDIRKNNDECEFEIVDLLKDERNKTVYAVRFIKSGYEKNVYGHNIKRGIVKDIYHPKVCGIGYIGNAKYKGNETIWHIWRGMLKRCYDEKATDYGYYGKKGVTVCDRWHSFEYFLEDIKHIEGFDLTKIVRGELELDKDLRSDSSKIYSPETTIFLSAKENSQLIKYNLKKFKAIKPTGEIFICEGISGFSKENNLYASSVSMCLSGKYASHKGWKFENI